MLEETPKIRRRKDKAKRKLAIKLRTFWKR